MSQHLIVKSRYQWRTLTTCSNVSAAKIIDYTNATEFGQECTITQLNGIASLGAVSYGLAVTSYGAYLLR
jgi:hypothetical protein